MNAYLIFMLISSVIVARPRILLLGEGHPRERAMRDDQDIVELGSVSELTQGSFMMDHYESLTMKDHWTDD